MKRTVDEADRGAAVAEVSANGCGDGWSGVVESILGAAEGRLVRARRSEAALEGSRDEVVVAIRRLAPACRTFHGA